MTAEEKKHYNNGFILGMASKGVIQKTITIEVGGERTLTWNRHDSFTSASVTAMTLEYIPIGG